MTSDNDALIKGVTEIANHEMVVNHLEPNVFTHTLIKEHQTERVLYALGLLLEGIDGMIEVVDGIEI
jgi:hypothetical protein